MKISDGSPPGQSPIFLNTFRVNTEIGPHSNHIQHKSLGHNINVAYDKLAYICFDTHELKCIISYIVEYVGLLVCW